jgi:hypothetical protein
MSTFRERKIRKLILEYLASRIGPTYKVHIIDRLARCGCAIASIQELNQILARLVKTNHITGTKDKWRINSEKYSSNCSNEIV